MMQFDDLDDLYKYLSNGVFITDILMNESDCSRLFKSILEDLEIKSDYRRQYARQNRQSWALEQQRGGGGSAFHGFSTLPEMQQVLNHHQTEVAGIQSCDDAQLTLIGQIQNNSEVVSRQAFVIQDNHFAA